MLVLAGAGSGKTSVLVARVGWLLSRQRVLPDQILLLAFGRQAATEMNSRINERLGQQDIQAKTFHALALHIIRECGKKTPTISELETDQQKKYQLLLDEWRAQCAAKKHKLKAGENGLPKN